MGLLLTWLRLIMAKPADGYGDYRMSYLPVFARY